MAMLAMVYPKLATPGRPPGATPHTGAALGGWRQLVQHHARRQLHCDAVAVDGHLLHKVPGSSQPGGRSQGEGW